MGQRMAFRIEQSTSQHYAAVELDPNRTIRHRTVIAVAVPLLARPLQPEIWVLRVYFSGVVPRNAESKGTGLVSDSGALPMSTTTRLVPGSDDACGRHAFAGVRCHHSAAQME